MINLLILAGFSALISLALVRLVIFTCYKTNILDIPNQRSSHQKPTALMGGIGFSLAAMSIFLLVQRVDLYTIQSLLLFLGFSSAIAVFSMVDDIKRLSASIRFAIHIIFALLAGLMFSKLTILQLPFLSINLAVLSLLFTVIFIVAMTNIYNFMDGIDGYAGGVGLLGCISLAFLAHHYQNATLSQLLLILAATLLGFLVWNYPKARIFMGDVGSAFLGFFFGGISIYLSQTYSFSILIPIMIFGVFIIDASVTLIRRTLNGEKFWEAHRSHFYQRLNILGWSHQRIIWLEFAHMVGCMGAAYLYWQSSSEWLKLGILTIFCCSFAIKFIWITYLENKSQRINETN